MSGSTLGAGAAGDGVERGEDEGVIVRTGTGVFSMFFITELLPDFGGE